MCKMIKKTLEELKLDLIEIQAYRNLQDEKFGFEGINDTDNKRTFSSDAYYEILEQDIIDEIEYLENNKFENKKKIKKIYRR